MLFCALYSIQVLKAQVITVVDQTTLTPVENVLINHEQQQLSLTTNHKGKAAADTLPASGYFIVSHPSYKDFVISAARLKSSNYQVVLQQKIITMGEVVVAANRWEQEKSQTPNRIISIGSKEIGLKNPQTTADMLAGTGQVFVQKSQLGGGSPMIRGFAANSVLIVVDGVRMNNAIFRGGNLQNIISIDPFSLENTEVLFGPGSVMYGSDALGGVMHFKTKDPGFINEKKPSISAGSVLRYSSADNERTGHLDLQIRGKRLSLLTSFTFSEFDHLNTGNKRTSKFPDYGKRFQYVQTVNGMDQVIENPDYNNQVYSGYHQLNLLNKIGLRLGGKSDLIYTFNYSTTSDIPRYDRLVETGEDGSFKSAEWYYGPQEWLLNSLQLNVYRSNKIFDAAKATLALQNLKESRHDRSFGDSWRRNRHEQTDQVTLNVDLEKNVGSMNTLFYGIEWFHNRVESSAEQNNIHNNQSEPIRPRYPDNGSDYSGVAAYLSHKWMPGAKVAVTSGIRFSQVWLEADYGHFVTGSLASDKLEISNNAMSGSLGLAWLPALNWQLNALFSTGFRAPNVDDIGKVFDGTNGIATVPNIELKPEYSYNMELGLTKSVEDKWKISGTIYYTILDNAIIQQNYNYLGSDSIYLDGEHSKTQALVNSESAKIYGGNAQLEWAFLPGLAARASFSVTRGEDSEGGPLRHTTPNFGFLEVAFQKNRFAGDLSYRFSGKRRFEDLPLVEQQKTHLYTSDGALAWQTLNLSGSYTFSRSLTITLGIDNILDHHYRPYASGISAAGRNYILALKGTL